MSLAIEGLDAGYGAVKALRGVTLHVDAGETVALLGTNGNGKSTLMKCVMGLVRPSRGRLALDDRRCGARPCQAFARGNRRSRRGAGAGGAAAVSEADGDRKPDAWRLPEAARSTINGNLALCYDTFPVLKERRSQLAGSMSGGQQQMLAIARALMSSPRLLLIDEPSVGLSPLLVSQTITMIGELKERVGLTVLMAEQNFHQAIRIADRGYIIVHGEIAVAAQSVDELKANDIVKRLYLGGVA